MAGFPVDSSSFAQCDCCGQRDQFCRDQDAASETFHANGPSGCLIVSDRKRAAAAASMHAIALALTLWGSPLDFTQQTLTLCLSLLLFFASLMQCCEGENANVAQVRSQARGSYVELESQEERHERSQGGACQRIVCAVSAITPHMTAAAWMYIAWAVKLPEARLLAGVLLVNVPNLPLWEMAACLALQLLWLFFFSGASVPTLHWEWGPVFVLLLSFTHTGAARIRDARVEPNIADAKEQLQSNQQSLFVKAVQGLQNWRPPKKSEVHTWIKLFALHEQLLGVYVCTVQGTIKHKGYLYISVNHVCFHAESFIKTYHFALPIEDLQDIRNEAKKGASILLLKRPLLMQGRREPVTSVELSNCIPGMAALMSLLAAHKSTKDDANDDDVEDDAPDDSSLDPASAAASVFVDDTPFQNLLQAHVPRLKLIPLARELLADEWTEGTLLYDYFNRQDVTELATSPWIDGREETSIRESAADRGALSQIREVSMRVPVPPAPMCPKSTRMTTTYRISRNIVGDNCSIKIESSCISHDVPFGENFCVQECTELVPNESGSSVTVTKSGRVIFLRSCGFLKGKIQSAAIAGQSKSGDVFVALLQERASRTPSSLSMASSPMSTSEPVRVDSTLTTCEVKIFELQRRTTTFHKDWRAPFLPHDGVKRRRWVDLSYQKHPWSEGIKRKESAVADEPPLRPSDKWTPAHEWEVDTVGGDTDGWQYAIDIYRGDYFWSANSMGMHVRRRLWSRTFVMTE